MSVMQRAAHRGVGVFAAVLLAACANTGSLGGVLGSVLGGGAQPTQVTGTVRSVDTRNQQITVQQSNGQNVAIGYDNQTKVTYQNQNYAVTSLENGDQITARIQANSNGAYYTDLVQVDQPVQGSTTSGSTGSEVVQSLQGTVREVDVAKGWFTIDASTNVRLTVTMPYNANRTDVTKFERLRVGDFVRLNGVYLNNSRVELRQFN